jgi:hypothetical protein
LRSARPIEAGDRGLRDGQSVHQGDDIDGEHRLLAGPRRIGRKESRRPVATQVWDDDAVAGGGQQRHDIGVAVDVIWPAVKKDSDRSMNGADIDVPDPQNPGLDPLQWTECALRSGVAGTPLHRLRAA